MLSVEVAERTALPRHTNGLRTGLKCIQSVIEFTSFLNRGELRDGFD